MFRINPYLQQPSSDGMYVTWFTEDDTSGEVTITGPGLDAPLSFTSEPTFEPILDYTTAELQQEVEGLEQGSWLLGEENYKHTVDIDGLLPDSTYSYSVTAGDSVFEASFTTAPTADDWETIRFVALSDSETEPRGRVQRRDWQQGALAPESLPRPALEGSLWAETLGVTGSRLNYPLTQAVGYRENLEIINSREPDFMVMPGDLVQGGGFQPGWDEFFRHNAGEFDSGLSEYPLLPALGNWENFGALNGGYGFDEDGRFGPLFGRSKYRTYFDTPGNSTPEHQDTYYRIDYGPIAVLTLDSSNGEPEDSRDSYGGEGEPPQVSGREFTEPGTDTQENYTREQYEQEGGSDLANFNPGSSQWDWAIAQLADAREQGQIVFVQFHNVPYSDGTHGLPMNHVDSSGQGGTPLRRYHPLFEEFGVAAVFSGHSEMFERSFVDEDNDGVGVHYYDVGVAGDGMRGERTDANGDLLNYNPFSQWTADQSEPELWQEVDGVPQLVAGGKHYGHLEVNVERLSGEDGGAQITLTPVYSFPILDANYDFVDTERRVYGDEVVLQVDERGAVAAEARETNLVFGGLAGDTLDSALGDFGTAPALVFAGGGNDLVDNTTGSGSRIYTGSGSNEVFGGRGDRIVGGDGPDTISTVAGSGMNRVYARGGDDVLELGSGDRALAGEGDDRLFFLGSSTVGTGGAGADQFWVANAAFPDAPNTITDFAAGEDVLGLAGIGIGDFAGLTLTGEEDTTIAALGNDIAVLLGVAPGDLSAGDVAFVL